MASLKLEKERGKIFENGLNKLKGAVSKASRELVKLLDSNNQNIRRLTVKDILTLAFKSIEIEDLEERIERIEEIIEKRFVS